jgi:hypothetical protein
MARVVKDGDIFSKPEFVFQQVNNWKF